jgi:tetratricopeptide (TPR) repeat protein
MAFEQMLGNAYYRISQRDSPENLKAEEHLKKAIDLGIESGAKGLLGPVYLDLGLLCRSEKRPDKSYKYISKAIQVFKECGASGWLDRCGTLY